MFGNLNHYLNKENWKTEKHKLLNKLRTINDILLVFELELDKEKDSDRFIIHDKKN